MVPASSPACPGAEPSGLSGRDAMLRTGLSTSVSGHVSCAWGGDCPCAIASSSSELYADSEHPATVKHEYSIASRRVIFMVYLRNCRMIRLPRIQVDSLVPLLRRVHGAKMRLFP